MTDRNNDDVARALEALSAGEHQEEPEHDSTAHLHAPEPVRSTPRPTKGAGPGAPRGSQQPPLARPVSAAPPRPATPRPAAPAAPKTAQPAAAAPKPVARPAAPAAARPAPPRPAAPPANVAANPVVRPAAPSRPAAPPVAATEPAPAPDSAIVDDDAVIVPAPDASVFFHKPTSTTKARKPAFGQSVNFRQTLIPILLTGGFIMVVLGLLHFLWTGENNPLADLPGWLLTVVFLFGLVLWALAAANMLSVKSALAQQRKASN